MLKEKLAKFVKRWSEQNLNLAAPNSEQQVIDCFLAIKSSVSRDIIELYTNVGGMIDGDMGESLLSIWTLERIEQENLTVSGLTFFADFVIESHRYAFKYENVSTSSVYSNYETAEFTKVADSIEQFFDLYLTNPNELGLFEE